MPSLPRTETLRSVVRWWSDSNPLVRAGASINLHAAAKPLMKLLYHRQARRFIEENRYAPLSEELVEIYASYLSSKYVSPRTEAVVLEHLRKRLEATEGTNTQQILSSSLLDRMSQMHMGPDTDRRTSWAYYSLLGTLVAQRYGLWLTLVMDISPILRSAAETDTDVFIAVISTLTVRGERTGDLGSLLATLLDSKSSQVRSQTCPLIRQVTVVARDVASILGVSTIVRLVGLLQDPDDSVVESAVLALAGVSNKGPGGAAAVLSTNILEYLPFLIDLNNPQPVCLLMSNLSRNKSDFILAAQHKISVEELWNLTERVVRDGPTDYVDSCVHLWNAIAISPEGAATLMSTAIWDYLEWIFHYSNHHEACHLIANLAQHESLHDFLWVQISLTDAQR
ncbi:hypothetical protein FB45DRAFT_1029212 [Roridomyces roridus]|uniref:ARM repeat-containing protein n=1 Tax=Roridomyces roridus TaxID=1738132 RepID=A0AAD7BP62_9AGAR|nr:hypothetical protein FB45DRAFT_1029212 [Roridomyces roridus]